MHKVAVAFFYTCAVLSITFTALVFIGKASAQGVNSAAPSPGRCARFAVAASPLGT
jgi:hypothetical protein